MTEKQPNFYTQPCFICEAGYHHISGPLKEGARRGFMRGDSAVFELYDEKRGWARLMQVAGLPEAYLIHWAAGLKVEGREQQVHITRVARGTIYAKVVEKRKRPR